MSRRYFYHLLRFNIIQIMSSLFFFFFFFNDPAPPDISPLPLPDALPICTSPPRSTRSRGRANSWSGCSDSSACPPTRRRRPSGPPRRSAPRRCSPRGDRNSPTESCRSRSEEHTSELQSQSNLVCRLLLEK